MTGVGLPLDFDDTRTYIRCRFGTCMGNSFGHGPSLQPDLTRKQPGDELGK